MESNAFGDSGAEADKDETDRLYGIYVDAPDETLLAALDAIQTLDGVVSVVATSVNEARDNASPGDRRLIADAESPTPAEAPVPAPPLRAAESEEAPEADSSATPENRRDRSPRDEPRAALDSAAARTDAYQLPVPLSNNAVEKMVQGQKPSDQYAGGTGAVTGGLTRRVKPRMRQMHHASRVMRRNIRPVNVAG